MPFGKVTKIQLKGTTPVEVPKGATNIEIIPTFAPGEAEKHPSITGQAPSHRKPRVKKTDLSIPIALLRAKIKHISRLKMNGKTGIIRDLTDILDLLEGA